MVAKGGKIPLNYYRSGRPESGNSPFVKKSPKTHKVRKFFVRTLDLVVVVILVVGLIYSILVKSTPRIVVNDTTYHSLSQYESGATRQLGALKNRNKISLDEQGIITSLRTQFPEISSASIELPVFSETPIIHLNVAAPSFFLFSGGTNYVIDSQGVATSSSKSLPKVKNLVTLSDQSGFDVRLGQQVLSAGNVAFIKSVLQQTTHAKVAVSSLVLPQQAEEVDLHTPDRPYYVKFYMGGDPILQTGQFLAARHNFDQTGKQPPSYLDVRVPGKIFYK